ncbi:hypothetical protein VPZ60_004228 [Salmonella enterica]|nr:hypothetical protein [Salmonella enterica]
MNLEKHYTRLAGQLQLFAKAPPSAEVVLEVIGEKRYIFAESFKGGARWWYWNGVRARRGLPGKSLSDYYCAATRQPKLTSLEIISHQQKEWDKTFGLTEFIDLTQASTEAAPVISNASTRAMRPCMVCGTLVADGMIHSCNPRWDITAPALDICPNCGVAGEHVCTRHPKFTVKEFVDEHIQTHSHAIEPAEPQTTAPAEATPMEFVSIFGHERHTVRNWIRINALGRIKLCARLQARFKGKRVDVMLDVRNQRLRIGESAQGKPVNARGFMHSRPAARLIDFGGEVNVFVYLDEREDGWLYGDVPLKDTNGPAPLDR